MMMLGPMLIASSYNFLILTCAWLEIEERKSIAWSKGSTVDDLCGQRHLLSERVGHIALARALRPHDEHVPVDLLHADAGEQVLFFGEGGRQLLEVVDGFAHASNLAQRDEVDVLILLDCLINGNYE